MNTQLSPIEELKLTTLVSSALTPGEKILSLFREHRKPLSWLQLLNPARVGSGLCLSIVHYDQFAPATLRTVLSYCGTILALGVLIFVMIHTQSQKASAASFFFTLVIYAIMVWSYLMAFKRIAGRAFVITNQRLVCLSFPDAKIIGWRTLDNLKSVEVLKRKDGTALLTFRIEPRTNPYILEGLDDPEFVRTLLETASGRVGAI
jgi:hypothetical protein